MPEANDSELEERYQSYLNIHLKKEQRDLPTEGKIEALQQRNRSKWWHLIINFAAIIFFGYSFYFDITQLGSTFFIIIMVVFVINVVLIFFQKNQINSLIQYLEDKLSNE